MDGVRGDSVFNAKMEVEISDQQPAQLIPLIFEIEVKRHLDLQEFIDYVQKDWVGQVYDRYEKNCYDLVIKTLIKYSQISIEDVQKINDWKAKQIKKFWD